MRNLFYVYLLMLPAAGATGYLMGDVWVAAALLAVFSLAMYAIHTLVVRREAARAASEASTELREYMEITRAASSHGAPPADIRSPHAD